MSSSIISSLGLIDSDSVSASKALLPEARLQTSSAGFAFASFKTQRRNSTAFFSDLMTAFPWWHEAWYRFFFFPRFFINKPYEQEKNMELKQEKKKIYGTVLRKKNS